MKTPQADSSVPRRFSSAGGYVLAVVFTGLALTARQLMDPVIGTRISYATFYAAVAASAMAGGLGPGILAAVLGALAAVYFIVPPRGTWLIEGAENQFGLALYLIVSALLAGMAEAQRRAAARLRSEIRAREAAEAAERAERTRFETTLMSIGDAVIATDAQGRITFMNQVAAAVTGWLEVEAIGQPLETVFLIRNEETGAVVENPATRAMRQGRIVGLANHTVLLTKDGRRIPIDDSGAPILDAAGATLGAVLVFRDVSEERARTTELRQRNRMIDCSHDAIIGMDAGRRITSWNRGAQELYGWEECEALGKVTHDLLRTRGEMSPDEVDAWLREHGRWEGALIHTCKDGREIVCESRHVLVVEGDRVAGLLEINRDVTERKEAEQRLRRVAAEAEEGRRTLEAVLDFIPEGIAIADAPDAKIRMVSRYGAELSGRRVEELLGTPAPEHPEKWGVYHADGKTPAQPMELPLTRAVVEGQVVAQEEWVLKRPNGDAITILCNAGPIRDAGGTITGGVIAWRDATARKRLEEKLREADKLESLGVLAGGIAHDFNNLLTGMLGNASLLADELPPGTVLQGCAEEISRSAEAAARLTQQMLAYSGRGRFVIEPVDVSEYVRQTTSLIRSSIPANVQLCLDLGGGLPWIGADPGQIQQIVMNLIINAVEAVGRAPGRVTVGTRMQVVDVTYIRCLGMEDTLKPGCYLALEVADTGCGMDAATLARIFDPFFTTKFTGRGLGLAAVQGIVRGHRGGLRVYSSPGRGSEFLVLMPAIAPVPVEAELPALNGVAVLLVDEEETVRRAAVAALRPSGCDVITASGASEAIAAIQERQARIGVAILDGFSPSCRAGSLAAELNYLAPRTPVVLSSAFSEMEAQRRLGERHSGYLQKPYTASALAHCVARATGAHKPPRIAHPGADG